MDITLKDRVSDLWKRYFPNAELPIAVFYSDTLHGAEYPKKPADNQRGYTCLYAQLSRVHKGEALAFDPENLGCFGAMKSIYGGYNEEAEVKLLVEIERFKKAVEYYSVTTKLSSLPVGPSFLGKASI